MRTRAETVVPRRLVDGDPRHGVVHYARQLDEEVARAVHADGCPPQPGPALRAGEPVHVHFTDKLFGSTPAAAAEWFVHLAARHPVSVTLHDLPQLSDGRHRRAREDAYAHVIEAARAVVCNSHHELALLADTLDVPPTTATVIPLPLATTPDPGLRPARAPGLQAAVLGFFYPGKGHDDVADAVLEAQRSHGGPERPRLHVLGAASGGHEEDLSRFVEHSAQRGLLVDTAGYLDETELVRHSRLPVVPVVAHQHISASGSLNSWIAAGRRPLVRMSRYAREMDALRPHTVTLYEPGLLAEAIRAATRDPGSTWLGEDAVLAPGLPDVAAAYLRWWREAVPW